MFTDLLRPCILFAALASTAGCLFVRNSIVPENIAVARYAERQLAENYNVDGPGAAVIVARGEEVVYRGARGMGDIEHATPLTPESLFKIGSITKQFVAAGLLRLVEDGKVALDDPLSKFIKNYPGGDAITLSMLLNHTSGIKNYTDIPGADVPLPEGITTTQLIERFENANPEFAPGTSWAYDNSGYVLIGAVIESVSGVSWHAYLKREFFKPLGLNHTGYEADPSTRTELVRGYAIIEGRSLPALGLSAVHADGALVSSVDDLLKWNLALHENRVLKSESYRRMITPIGEAIPEQYGLGVWHTTLQGRDMIAHSGHISGFSAYLLYLPATHVSVAILQNSDRARDVADPTESARRLAAFAIGAPYEPQPPIEMDPATLRQAEGIYGTDLPGASFGRTQGAHVLCVIDGALTVARTGDIRSELIPIAADTFRSRDSLDRVHLERDAAGNIDAIRFFPWGEGVGQLLARTSQPAPAGLIEHANIESYVGDYSADGMTLHVFVDGSRLKAALGPTSIATLVPASTNTFVVAEVDATLEFTSSDNSRQTATLRQGREIVEFNKQTSPLR